MKPKGTTCLNTRRRLLHRHAKRCLKENEVVIHARGRRRNVNRKIVASTHPLPSSRDVADIVVDGVQVGSLASVDAAENHLFPKFPLVFLSLVSEHIRNFSYTNNRYNNFNNSINTTPTIFMAMDNRYNFCDFLTRLSEYLITDSMHNTVIPGISSCVRSDLSLFSMLLYFSIAPSSVHMYNKGMKINRQNKEFHC